MLLELGADVNIRNGYEMMALDYARDQVSEKRMNENTLHGAHINSAAGSPPKCHTNSLSLSL